MDGNGADVERVGETETPLVEIREDKVDTTAEVKADTGSNEAVNEFDWEGYLENQAAAAPMPSYKSNNEDLPSLEATLTRGTSLFDHLEWQLKLSHFTQEEDGIAMLIIGNLTPDGYLEDAARGPGRGGRRHASSWPRRCSSASRSSIRSASRRARSRSAC